MLKFLSSVIQHVQNPVIPCFTNGHFCPSNKVWSLYNGAPRLQPLHSNFCCRGQLAFIYLVKLGVYYTNLLLSITRCIRGWSWLFGIYMELSWASSTQRNLFLSTYQNMKWTGPNWTEIHFVWSYYYYYYFWFLVVSRFKEIIFTSLNFYVWCLYRSCWVLWSMA